MKKKQTIFLNTKAEYIMRRLSLKGLEKEQSFGNMETESWRKELIYKNGEELIRSKNDDNNE